MRRVSGAEIVRVVGRGGGNKWGNNEISIVFVGDKRDPNRGFLSRKRAWNRRKQGKKMRGTVNRHERHREISKQQTLGFQPNPICLPIGASGSESPGFVRLDSSVIMYLC